MNLSPDQASAALRDIATTARRTRQSLIYDSASPYLILWGIVVAAGYVAEYLAPRHGRAIWVVTTLVGCALWLALALVRRRRRQVAGVERAGYATNLRVFGSFLALAAFGIMWTALLSPINPRQIDILMPTVFMLGYVIAGLWAGRFFVICGVVGTALIVLSYYYGGAYFHLWMAALDGGVLILSGLYLRWARRP